MQDMESDISADSLKSDGTLHCFHRTETEKKTQDLFEVCQVLFGFFFVFIVRPLLVQPAPLFSSTRQTA